MSDPTEEKSAWEGALDSEIARLSKDADALLESIRLVGSPTPERKKPILDDLSDDETLPDDLKISMSLELEQAEETFRSQSPEDSFGSASRSLFPEQPEKADDRLLFLMCVTWIVVFTMARFAKDHMLDEHGQMVLPWRR